MDIHVVDGTIEQIGKGLSAPSAQVIDLKGKIVAPGFIDMHVHLREPGFEYKETIATGVRRSGGRRVHRSLLHAEHEPADRRRIGRPVHPEQRRAMALERPRGRLSRSAR